MHCGPPKQNFPGPRCSAPHDDITVRSVADLNSTTLVQRQSRGSQLRPTSHRRLVDHGFWSTEIGRGAQSRVIDARSMQS